MGKVAVSEKKINSFRYKCLVIRRNVKNDSLQNLKKKNIPFLQRLLFETLEIEWKVWGTVTGNTSSGEGVVPFIYLSKACNTAI